MSVKSGSAAGRYAQHAHVRFAAQIPNENGNGNEMNDGSALHYPAPHEEVITTAVQHFVATHVRGSPLAGQNRNSTSRLR